MNMKSNRTKRIQCVFVVLNQGPVNGKAGLRGDQRLVSKPKSSYTGDVLFICVVKFVDFLLEGVQDLTVPCHVCSQDQCDGSLKPAQNENN